MSRVSSSKHFAVIGANDRNQEGNQPDIVPESPLFIRSFPRVPVLTRLKIWGFLVGFCMKGGIFHEGMLFHGTPSVPSPGLSSPVTGVQLRNGFRIGPCILSCYG